LQQKNAPKAQHFFDDRYKGQMGAVLLLFYPEHKVLIKYSGLKSLGAAFLFCMLLFPIAGFMAGAEESADETARTKALRQEAALNLWRLNKAIEDDGFYAARMALNIWRSTAVDAGTFDQAKYNEFKKKLYEKSVADSQACFEFFLLEENYYDAAMCLQTWKIHSQELGSYDPEKYDEMKNRMETAKTQKKSDGKTPE
jgi:hypothetical protein